MSEHAQTLDMLARILAAIEKNHDATIQLAEALAGVRAATVAKVEATKAIDKAMTEPAAPVVPAEVSPVAPAKAVEAPAAAAPTELDYKRDVAPTMAKLLSAKGAPAVVALLSQFGVKKGAELPADKLADALAAANAALGE